MMLRLRRKFLFFIFILFICVVYVITYGLGTQLLNNKINYDRELRFTHSIINTLNECHYNNCVELQNFKTFHDDYVSTCKSRDICELNNHKTRTIKKLDMQYSNCTVPDECVTVTIKTAGRYKALIRVVISIRILYPKIQILIVDDPDNIVPKYFQKFIDEQNLMYLKADTPGISGGRNLAVKSIKTQFGFMVDDDVQFTTNSDLNTLLKIMNNYDVSVLGGALKNNIFSGVLKFTTNENNELELDHYQARYYPYETLNNVCVQVDIALNIFMYKKLDIIESGLWNPELYFGEHEDIFLKLMKKGKKVGFCPGFVNYHQSSFDFIKIYRYFYWKYYVNKLKSSWNLTQIVKK